jgi:membrane protein DedA with SNARE-associated domain
MLTMGLPDRKPQTHAAPVRGIPTVHVVGKYAPVRRCQQKGISLTSFVDPLIAFVSAHAWLAYLTIFLAALLEAVPIVGSVIPGSTIILALSALVPGGELDLVGVFAAAIAGAALGDGSAFWIGHRTQREILNAWPMSRYPNVIAQSEAFFHRWGTLAVFFARFVPPIRAFVPITAGALAMPPLRFYPVNIAAILLWAPAHILPGVLAVSALDRAGGLAGLEGTAKHYWMPLVIGGALIVAVVVWIIRRRRGGNAIEPARVRVRKGP